jgi:DNA recombination protein RmuC
MEAFQQIDLIWIIVGLSSLVLAGLVYALRQYQGSIRELKNRLETSQRNEYSLRESLHKAEKVGQAGQLELEHERKIAAQRIVQFEQNRKQLKIEFENLANRILEDKARSFDKTSRGSLEAMLKPFREQVEGFQKRVNEVHSESVKGNATLESEIKKVLETGMKMSGDAQNLTNALKGDSQRRGSWGETQLEKTLQMSGLVEHDHYQKQTSMQDAEGKRKQTDFLIKLPDDKHIIIDSKVSLAAYDRAVGADSDEQLELALVEHVKAVKRHIDDLAGKDYTNLAGIRSPSFVLMFMPIEPAYIEALKYEKDLFAYGYERGVVLVSHTTLIPILTTVANLWSMERSTREARELGDKAGDIYNQVRKVAEHLQKLGSSLQAVNNHYTDTARSLTGRQGLRGKVERFAEMSSKVTKSVPEIEPLHSDQLSEGLQLLAEPLEPENAPGETEEEASTT